MNKMQFMSTNELADRFAETCMNFGGDIETVIQQAEDILTSVLSDTAEVSRSLPIRRIILNCGHENESYIAVNRLDNKQTEITDMYTIVTDVALELSDTETQQARFLFAPFFSRARRAVLLKILRPDCSEGVLNVNGNGYTELTLPFAAKLFRQLTPIALQGDRIEKNGLSCFFEDEKSKRAYLKRITRKETPKGA